MIPVTRISALCILKGQHLVAVTAATCGRIKRHVTVFAFLLFSGGVRDQGLDTPVLQSHDQEEEEVHGT